MQEDNNYNSFEEGREPVFQEKKKQYKSKWEIIAVTVIITAIMTFMSTTAFYNVINKDSSTAASRKINEALEIIDKNYLYNVDQKALSEATINAMVDSLGDPYAFYLNKEDYKNYSMQLNGTYYGIGVVMSKADNGDIVVVSTIEKSPAKSAGLESGDIILAVDGVKASKLGYEMVAKKIRGEIGTKVTISVKKHNNGEIKEVSAIRAAVHQESVSSKVVEDGIGYIAISTFDDKTGTDFSNQLKGLTDKGVKVLIIDGRNNGGGLVSSAYQVADDLMSKKPVFYSVNKQGKKVGYRTTEKDINFQVVMLINEGSASATEILAGALKDNGVATLVGKKSFGKGIMQMPIPLSDGSCIQVTIEKYLTPNGNDIHKKGIKPDYEVELKTAADEQLQKAISIAKEKLK